MAYKLIEKVINLSNSKEWNSAVLEWFIYDYSEDEEACTSCVCGKEGLRYLFTIKNRINGNILYPIGSSCIKKFHYEELYTEASLIEKEFALYHAVENDDFIELKGGLFSRKLIGKLYEEGAFKPTEYNNFDGKNDYQFLLDMFNKREPSSKQKSKASAIILDSIKPFIKQKLKNKIK